MSLCILRYDIINMNIVMQLWDDLVSSKTKVMVIGATNRDDEIDAAVRRRFERTFFIGRSMIIFH